MTIHVGHLLAVGVVVRVGTEQQVASRPARRAIGHACRGHESCPGEDAS